jgi:hypothetical protein
MSSARLKGSIYVHKVENSSPTSSLTLSGPKGCLSYDMDIMWKLTWLMLQQAHILSRLLNYGNSLYKTSEVWRNLKPRVTECLDFKV